MLNVFAGEFTRSLWDGMRLLSDGMKKNSLKCRAMMELIVKNLKIRVSTCASLVDRNEKTSHLQPNGK